MTTIAEFQLTERVAQGGMAEVWRAFHEPTETVVALKLPASKGGRVDPRLARALHHEATAMVVLRSSRVVQVHDVGVVTALEARDLRRAPRGRRAVDGHGVGGRRHAPGHQPAFCRRPIPLWRSKAVCRQ